TSRLARWLTPKLSVGNLLIKVRWPATSVSTTDGAVRLGFGAWRVEWARLGRMRLAFGDKTAFPAWTGALTLTPYETRAAFAPAPPREVDDREFACGTQLGEQIFFLSGDDRVLPALQGNDKR